MTMALIFSIRIRRLTTIADNSKVKQKSELDYYLKQIIQNIG